ncbi:unnamed protein product [Polarella glacialis]|uniref:Peptidylprolyl isomerase n=1 Tax=Polarella glacialis TaxID=89957 RepID=A0A813FRF1_POLGL|nr:unnamed protein product [Polarella glacialis]
MSIVVGGSLISCSVYRASDGRVPQIPEGAPLFYSSFSRGSSMETPRAAAVAMLQFEEAAPLRSQFEEKNEERDQNEAMVAGRSGKITAAAEVTVDLEVFEVPDSSCLGRAFASGSLSLRLPLQRLQLVAGNGDESLPEEMELAIPRLKQGVASEVLCRRYGGMEDTHGRSAPWKVLSDCVGKTLLFKLNLVEAEDLCLATLPANERLDYAKDRKEAGSRFFKRGCSEAALERYSLAAELLGHIDDIKDSSQNKEAKEVRTLCELNAAACLLKLENWRGAEAVCSAVLRQNPDNEKALFRRAKALLAQGDGPRAQVDLRKVLDANPGNGEARQMLQEARREGRGTAREKKVYAKMLSPKTNEY